METLRAALQLSPAVKQLQQGCSRLGLEEDTALELVCFLHLRRRFMPGDSEPLCLSPGTEVDKLWHWMLLNTKVAKEVYALIGGDVDHASTDEDDLGDDTKVVRRLAALNLLAALGWNPKLRAWEEPHTPLHHIQQITLGPQKTPLYIHSNASSALGDTLAGLVQEAGTRLLPADGLWGAVTAGGYTAGQRAGGGRKRRMSAADGPAASKKHADGAEEACQGDKPDAPADIILVFTPKHSQAGLQCCLQVPFAPDITIGDLYTTAAQHLSSSSCNPTQQQLAAAGSELRLFYLGEPLPDKGSSLAEAGLEGGEVVRVLQDGQELPQCFQFFIKMLTGRTSTFQGSSCMLVQEVKLQLRRRGGFPLRQQRLTYAGGQLWEDTRTLQDYKIGEQSTLNLCLRLGGC